MRCAPTATPSFPSRALMGKTTRRGHASAHLPAACARHPRLHRLLRRRHRRPLHRAGLLRRRRPHERAPHHRRHLRRHRSPPQAAPTGLSRALTPASPFSSPPTTKRRSSSAPFARCSIPTTKISTSSSSTTARTDRTFEVAANAYASEIAAGRVQVLTKPNGGKAAALNYRA